MVESLHFVGFVLSKIFLGDDNPEAAFLAFFIGIACSLVVNHGIDCFGYILTPPLDAAFYAVCHKAGVFSLVHEVVVDGGGLSAGDPVHFRVHNDDDRLRVVVAFLDVELSAAAIHAAAVAFFGLVVGDFAAIHVDDAVGDMDAATMALFGDVGIGFDSAADEVAVEGDVAFLVLDAAAVVVGGVFLDDGGLRPGGCRGCVHFFSARAGGDVAFEGVDAAAIEFDGAVADDVAAIEEDVAVVVVEAAA